MSTEILLLAVLGGITLLGYMIAINAHGPTRLGLSYFIATLMLAGSVWAVVQYVNQGTASMKIEELERLEMEKQKAEERIASQEKALRQNKERLSFAARLNGIITQGTGLASTMINTDLRDRSVNLDVLMGRATSTKKKTSELSEEFSEVTDSKNYFPDAMEALENGVEKLQEAGKFYWLYYRSEDTPQEELRERIMRQRAREAYELFQKAGNEVAAAG